MWIVSPWFWQRAFVSRSILAMTAPVRPMAAIFASSGTLMISLAPKPICCQ